jgi:uncharacterized protein with HEPN domain
LILLLSFMPSEIRRDEQWLADIVTACQQVQSFTEGLTKEAFGASDLHTNAALYSLVIIGEAASKISAEVKTKYPDVPWQQIKDFRNFAVHAYFGINLQIAWEAAQRDVPELELAIVKILETEFPEFWG